eukprot:CAMPEP_0175073910 /NCGR_PEP_ID=MMETSP0052_2-20121109/20897_1 /TAXON_ID=51329 ORGANISM="Polytomella parva, Strain SAG 63-3" /NCGR_SAMPLE_ID=MMETSP0052_2 /ASSEMBLY_ACC=CAM_ASM_000194 /LENGTH=550 /DNA_ID=CAMNT_0016341917 /DNA_START=146 /DNA_END=1798 /DNA_ORIENTATION=-
MNVTSSSTVERMGSAHEFQIVVASAENGGIGLDGKLPWTSKLDMQYFKRLTSTTRDPMRKNAVIMGRHTWETLPLKFRPLPGRINIVLSSGISVSQDPANNLFVCKSMDAAFELVASTDFRDRIETVFVIGGGQVYEKAIKHPGCSAIHYTRVNIKGTSCSVFFPINYLPLLKPQSPILETGAQSPVDPSANQFRLWSCSNPIFDVNERRDPDDEDIDYSNWQEELRKSEKRSRFHFLCYTRIPTPSSPPFSPSSLPPAINTRHEEYQYLDLVREVIDSGVARGDRTGTGTLSVFGRTMTFNLRHGTFPLLTTKRVFWRGVAEELLWFISGKTDANLLKRKNVTIWDGNGSREYLDSIGLTHREEGDLGPVYGFQWRHFGAEYGTMHDDYTDKGIDQLKDVINRIKANPNDRRLIMTAWNPAALKDMALPPCHMICQFYVANGEVSCMMNQRSCDLGLGVPFNIASYALLTRLISQVCGLMPGDFIHVLGDAHVYSNHIEPLKQQLKNEPRHFPTLKINANKTVIDDFLFEDFQLEGYNPHPSIKMDMAV